jgi:hypothetical protein
MPFLRQVWVFSEIVVEFFTLIVIFGRELNFYGNFGFGNALKFQLTTETQIPVSVVHKLVQMCSRPFAANIRLRRRLSLCCNLICNTDRKRE